MARQEKAGQAQVCPLAKKCGGCDYQGIAYEEQLKKKEQTVKKLMKIPIVIVIKFMQYFPEDEMVRSSPVFIRRELIRWFRWKPVRLRIRRQMPSSERSGDF